MRLAVNSRLWSWIAVVLLVAGGCWTANLTLFNWWAAGGPPSSQPEVYEQRGNLFFALTLTLFLSASVLAAVTLRRRRRDQGVERGSD